MRKFFLVIAVAIAATSASAQLRVFKDGQVMVGSNLYKMSTMTKSISKPDDGISFNPDSLSSIVVYGKGENGSHGYITFGNGKYTGIGEAINTSALPVHRLWLLGSNGITYTNGTNTVFSHTGGSAVFKFNCKVSSPEFVTTSDARLKKDVEPLENVTDALDALTPVSYRLTARPVAKDAAAEEAPVAPDDRTRFGFIAQEVREVFPELVSEDEEGYLGIDYMGFIPVLVDAVKQLRGEVARQEEVIATLAGPSRKAGKAGVDDVLDTEAALFQNRPNPFTSTTSIRYTLPEDVTSAFICIYDLQGKQIARHDLNERGNAELTIDGSTLQPGMYVYTLIADGMEIASKRMILTD